MLRSRLAMVVLVASLGLTTGCGSLCSGSLCGRTRARGPECIDLGVSSVGEGPVLDGFSPAMPPPNGAVPLTPQGSMPQLTTPPRLVPQPSQPMPYTP